MGVLDQITEMRNSGMEDREISQTLREQGIPPRQINDALSQAQIKQAVSNNYDEIPSPMSEEYGESFDQEQYGENSYEDQKDYSQQEYTPEENYAPESYGYEENSGGGTDTIIEIAEQVFSEKIKKIEKQVEENKEFKILAETKIENISERLKRIENHIDKLQVEILEKVGSFGRGLESTKKELDMVQDSFQKMVNPLAEHHKKQIHKKK